MFSFLLVTILCLQSPQPAGFYDKFEDRTVIGIEDPILLTGYTADGVLLAAARQCPGKADCQSEEIVLVFVFTGSHVATTPQLQAILLVDGERHRVQFEYVSNKYSLGLIKGQSFRAAINRKDLLRIIESKQAAGKINGYEFDITPEQLKKLKVIFEPPRIQ